MIMLDETNPKTSENSTVLLHPGTEIYVAPRLRKVDPESTPMPNGSISTKGKEKDKSAKMRLIPGRIAGAWVEPDHPDVGELEEVIFCSERSLRRVRRKFSQEGDGAIYVRLKKLDDMSKAEQKVDDGTEGGSKEKEEDMGMEGWLMSWDEIPDECCVIAGAAKDEWSEWASIRSASNAS